MYTKEAIVLAGGLGTRLQGVLPDIPKCMAPVNGKPFLAYVLDYLIDQKINKVILSVGYRKDHIINYFDNIYKSISIDYSLEHEPLGTGGAIKLALNHSIQDKVFVLNGDTYFLPEIEEMEKLHIQKSADISIAVKYMHETNRYGLVQMDDDRRIISFKEKDPQSESGWINGGIYLINKQIFDTFQENKFSLENDLFKVSCLNLRMQAFQTDAFFLDLGIPEDYEKAQTLIKTAGKNE